MGNIELIKRGNEVRIKIKQKIIEYINKHGYSPTVREIGKMVGLKSTSSVHRHLRIMFETGMLETDGEFGTARSIRVPEYKIVKIEGDSDGGQ